MKVHLEGGVVDENTAGGGPAVTGPRIQHGWARLALRVSGKGQSERPGSRTELVGLWRLRPGSVRKLREAFGLVLFN